MTPARDLPLILPAGCSKRRRSESPIPDNVFRCGNFRRPSLCVALASLLLCLLTSPASGQNWPHLAIEAGVATAGRGLTQRFLATDIPVTGKARKLLVTVSGHVGQASISVLSEAGREALYVYIRSESDRVGNLRYTLPVETAALDDVYSIMLGTEHEAVLELPLDAEIKLTIRAKELDYQGVEVKELQSELEVRHVLGDGTEVTQRLKIEPFRLFEQDGHKCKDMKVEFERGERTKQGESSRTSVHFELRELRSEDFEGRLGGPPVFARRT